MSNHIANNQNIQPATPRSHSVDYTQACILEMASRGLQPDSLIVDGCLKRFSADTKKHKPDEWYIAFDVASYEGKHGLICIYGSWSSGEKYTYCSWDNTASYSKEDIAKFRTIQKQKAAEAEKKIKEERDKEALEAARIWEEAAEQPPTSEYMHYVELKGVNTIGVRFAINPSGHESIIIPFKNVDGDIRALEYISYDKENKKKYPRCFGSRTDCFHVVGNLTIKNGDAIMIAEGWATAVSIYMAMSGVVVAVGGANNIEKVVGQLRQRYPESAITITGDLGRGEQPARLAASKYNCNVVFPQFPQDKNFDADKDEPYTDFNDLHKVCGIEELRKQLLKISNTASPQDDLKTLAKQLLKEEDPCASFNIRTLPPVLSNYLLALEKKTEAHPVMITGAVLIEISAFLGINVSMDYYGNLYPNLWILCITDSGAHKSTAINYGTQYARQNQEKINYEISKINEQKAYELSKEELLSLEKERLNLSIKDVLLPETMTGAALMEHLAQGHKGAIIAHEFSAWHQNFFKSVNNDLKAVFTLFYDVPPSYRYKTRTAGDHIIKLPYISLFSVSALPWVREELNIKDVESGFFARFLVFNPPTKDESDYGRCWKRPATAFDANAESIYNETLERIKERIAQSPIRFVCSTAAQKCIGDDEARTGIFYILNKYIREYNDETKQILKIYIKRWIPCLLKLSMIMQLFIDPESNEISTEAVLQAYSFLYPAIKSTIKLFEEELGESELRRKASKLLKWITKNNADNGSVVRKKMLNSHVLKGGHLEYDYVCEYLEECGKIKINHKDKGQSTWTYSVVEED